MSDKEESLTPNEMQEMMELFQYFQVYIDFELKERLKSKISGEQSINAINELSSMVKETYSKSSLFQHVNGETFLKMCELAEELYFDKYLSFTVPTELENSKIDLFEFLGKKLHEDFYSDNLASILDSYSMGDFSKTLLREINQKYGFEVSPFEKAITRREVPLREFGETGEFASMRIDVVVQFGKNILLIENKTKTNEHDHQTTRYYNAVKKHIPEENIFCLFLAPYKQPVSCSEFKFMTYFDLFLLMNKSICEFQGEINLEHIEPFYNELKRLFFDPELKAVLNAKKYRSAS